MQEIQCTEHIVHYGHNMSLGKGIRLQPIEDAVQVHVDAIHDEEDVAEGFLEPSRRLLRRNENIEQSRREHIILHLSQLSHNDNFAEHLSTLIAV